MSEFTCHHCKRTFEQRNDEQWNEEKSREEFNRLYPEYDINDTYVLCGTCLMAYKKWFDTLTERDKKRMREAYESKSK